MNIQMVINFVSQVFESTAQSNFEKFLIKLQHILHFNTHFKDSAINMSKWPLFKLPFESGDKMMKT